MGGRDCGACGRSSSTAGSAGSARVSFQRFDCDSGRSGVARAYAELVDGLRGVVGERNVSTSRVVRVGHARNANQLFELEPRVVVFVEREEQLKQVLDCVRSANKREGENVFSVTFAAGRSNRVGAALGDIVVRPRNYEAWNADEGYSVVSSCISVPLGVTFENFLDALKTVDSSGPRDIAGYPPSSKLFCHVVGAAAMGAGASAMKGGTMRDMVDSVKLVLPEGAELWSDDSDAIKRTEAYMRMKNLLGFVEGFLSNCRGGEFQGDVSWLCETYSLYRGGNDPLPLIEALKERVREDFAAGRTTSLADVLASNDRVKSVCGYDLSELGSWREKPSLTKLMVGSEGTLAVFERVRMKTVPATKHVATAAFYFDSVEKMQQAIVRVKKMVERGETTVPAGVEFMDEQALQVVRQTGKFNVPSDAKGLLLIDLSGDDEKRLRAEGERVLVGLHSFMLNSDARFSFDQAERDKLWAARRSMSSTLQKNLGKERFSAGFVEDVAVPIEKFAEFHAFVTQYFSSIAGGLHVTTFGHIEKSDVNLHINVVLGERQSRSLDLKRIADAVHARAVELGGTCTAEHGIGTSFRRDFWVKEEGRLRYELMRAIKYFVFQAGFLNDGCMFPNAIIDAGRYAGVRVGEERDGVRKRLVEGAVTIRGADETIRCVSDRKCDVVCPAGIEPSNVPLWVRALERGELSLRELRTAVWSCLGDGRCERACDAGVSPRDLIWQLRAVVGPGIRKRLLLAALETANASEAVRALGSRFGVALSACAGVAGVRFPVAETLRFDREGMLAFEKLRLKPMGVQGNVVLFPGCFGAVTGNDVRESSELLQKLGKNAVIPFDVTCCGLPFLANGLPTRFDEKARATARTLAELARDDRVEAIVTPCASCDYTIHELYPKMGVQADGLEALAGKFMALGAYVASLGVSGLNVDGVVYHQPCHQLSPSAAKLGIASLPDKCCGMGGTAGLFDYKLAQAVRAKRMADIRGESPSAIVTDCPTCELNLRAGVLEEGLQTRVTSLAKLLNKRVK